MAKEEKNLTPEVESQQKLQVSADSEDVIALAKKTIQDQEPVLRDGVIADQFKGLPMDTLIAAPLIATAEAQQRLAATAYDFYEKIAFEDKGGESKKAKTVDLEFQRPVMQDGKMTTITQKVSAPFIGLVPIPSLLVDRVDVDFQMEVTDSQVQKSTQNASVETSASAKWFTFNANVAGKVATTRENTRTTDNSAKYQIHVSASQQPPTEGLSKLMDIMASCVEPIESNEK